MIHALRFARGSSPNVDDSAFDLVPETSDGGSAALCLHGLTGTPYEVRPLADALVARGIRARGIWMAGHGGTIEDLHLVHRQEWVDRASAELEALRASHDRVFLVGVSMGGVVCLKLAQSIRIEGLAVVGVPLEFAPPVPQLLPFLRPFLWGKRKGESDIQEPVARGRHPFFPVMPFDAVRELIRLQAETVPGLGKISAPIFVSHGAKDGTARPEDAEQILASVQSTEKKLMMLPRSGHVATVDFDGAALSAAAAAFLADC